MTERDVLRAVDRVADKVDRLAVDLEQTEFLAGLGFLALSLQLSASTVQTLTQGARTMADLSRISAEVTENGDAVQSAVALLGILSDEIRANATDPAALAALADQLDADGTALATAVAANTPAAPGGGGEVPPPEPAPA